MATGFVQAVPQTSYLMGEGARRAAHTFIDERWWHFPLNGRKVKMRLQTRSRCPTLYVG